MIRVGFAALTCVVSLNADDSADVAPKANDSGDAENTLVMDFSALLMNCVPLVIAAAVPAAVDVAVDVTGAAAFDRSPKTTLDTDAFTVSDGVDL